MGGAVSALDELRTAVRTADTEVGPAMVAVGRGAGMVVAEDRILTNAHNLTGPSTEVRFPDGRNADAVVAAADVDGDLAVLTVETGDVPPIAWAEDGPELGAAVLAVGAPRRGPARVTVGFVSATGRRFRGPGGRPLVGVEHTAPVGRGSSGGPIVDLEGKVVGIDTHRRGDGFYLALPATAALRERVDRLGRGETPHRRRLGIAIAPPEVARRLRAAVGLEERTGVLVREVEDGEVAAVAGLREGDLVVAANRMPVTQPDDLLEAVDGAGDSLVLQVVRGEREIEITVGLATTDG
jgi:serine protease Do